MALRRLDPAVKHWSGLTPFTQSHRIGLANVKFGQEFRNSNVGLTSGSKSPTVGFTPFGCCAATVKSGQAAANQPCNRGQANVAGSSRPRGFTPPAMKHPQSFVGAVRVKPTEFFPSSIRPPEPVV
ncbi:hypothetical protein PGT21_023946 [Puccinia graminis f. sp. tritici]|uniref:Uncharacterized protein n=1 Tax=Puccinia graminis f. sp. tritici TaxID=56615 RepID=A0A5B0LV64_PUCGR|nr:hypothetical protein PGT21_023946 [Puccinia graminis f. sp. tritici]